MARPSMFATTLALLFVLAPQPSRAQAFKWREFPEIDISVRGVTLGTPYAEVLERLGEPLAYGEHGQVHLPDCLPKSAVFVYLGLVVRLGGAAEDRSDFHVWSIEVNMSNWAVAPGIRIGESMKDVRGLLGEPGHEVVAFGGKQRNIIYATAGKTGIATLVFRGGEKLQMIVLAEACGKQPPGDARRAGQ